MPQPAWKLDARPVCHDNELLVEVDRLNIDSASFNQLKEEAGGDPERVKERILGIVAERGKMHNPVTNSGGMLIGRVLEIGPSFPDQGLKRGEKIATLVSLTLTPLSLEAVERVDLETGQVEVRGKAVLFASGPFARLPDDLPESVALAVLDVCGAPAQTARLVRPGQRVAVLGAGGKSGLLCLWHAKKQAGPGGRVIALEAGEAACEAIRNLALADEVIRADATRPVEVLEKVERATGGRLADVTINCVNVPHTELSSILCHPGRRDGLLFQHGRPLHRRRPGGRGRGEGCAHDDRQRIRSRPRGPRFGNPQAVPRPEAVVRGAICPRREATDGLTPASGRMAAPEG